VLLTMLALVASAACGRSAPADDAKTTPAAGAGGMAGMPGMAPTAGAPAGSSTDVTLTADQIAHGGVRWSAVTPTAIADSVDLPGRLVADEDHTARLSPSVRGRVTDVRANVGDTVGRGQVLVVLQSEEAAARRADVASAAAALTDRQATLTYARSARERAERLLALKAGPAQDVERARADEATAQAGVTEAEAALAHAKTALSVLDVNPATGLVELAAPINGLVVTRDVVVGAVLDAGAPALVITDPSMLWLEFGAPEDLAARLKPGQRVPFDVSSTPAPRDARILRISGVVDSATRLVTVRAVVANARRVLKPEMFATVHVEKASETQGIVVPYDAVQLIDQRPVVFLAEPDGRGGAKFTRRDVQTGSTINGHTHITSGLKPGDVVVSAGAFSVKALLVHTAVPMNMGR
jgi:cobalt-zinc-cadmium efflux system membrane fusion protein